MITLNPYFKGFLIPVNASASYCDSRQLMAAKNSITWPDKQKHSSSITVVLKQHNLAESAKIKHKMAESTKSINGLDWPLMRFQLLTAEKTSGQQQDLSVETRSRKQPERDILAAAANLYRESQLFF